MDHVLTSTFNHIAVSREDCLCAAIAVVQGDSIEAYFYLEDSEVETIAKVNFTSGSLNFTTELTYLPEDKAYKLYITNPDAEVFVPGFYYYDLTADLVDGGRLTLVHNGNFTILKKRNVITEEEPDTEPDTGGSGETEDEGAGDGTDEGTGEDTGEDVNEGTGEETEGGAEEPAKNDDGEEGGEI